MNLKDAMIGNIKQTSAGSRSDFGFAGDLGQLPPNLDALISYSNANGTFGPFLSGGFDPLSFKEDSWGYALAYSYSTDVYSRREAAIITSLGSDNAIGGTGTAEDIQVSIYTNEVIPVSTSTSNVLVRFITAPSSTFSANITIHLSYKDGEGADEEQTISSPVTITGNVGNPRNNYPFGISSGLTKKLPVGIIKIWADIDRDSSGNLLNPTVTGPAAYVTASDMAATLHADSLSISVP